MPSSTKNPPAKAARPRSSVASIAAKNVLDSRRLLYFYQVARLGSFTTAEAVLDVAQSAISRQIQQLETDVGQKLLERNGRGVALTASGEIVYRKAEEILREMSDTMDLLEAAKRQPGGQVAIATPPIFTNLYMPEVVRRFVSAFPDVRLTAYEASTGQVYDYLASGQVDLAIVLHSFHSQKLELQKLLTEPIMLVAAATNPIAKRTSVRRSELPELPIILSVGSHGSRNLVEAYCEEGGISLDPIIRLDSLSMTKALVASGAHCALFPKTACAAELESGEFVAIPLDPVLKRSVYLARLRDRPQTPYSKAIARELAAVLKSRTPRSA